MRTRIFAIFAILTMNGAPLQAQWIRTNWPDTGSIESIATIGSNIFVGTGWGLLLSTDDGSIWSPPTNGSPSSVNVLIANDSEIFAGGTANVYRSTDDGLSWERGNENVGKSYVYALTANDSMVFAGTDQYGIFLSTDNGRNWNATSDSGITSYGNSFGANALFLYGSNLFAAINLGNGGIGGVYLSTDQGSSWVPRNAGLPESPIAAAFAVIGSNLFVSTYDSGVFRSTDNGSNWSAVNSGLAGYNLYVPLAVDGTNLFAGTQSGTVFLSTNYGESWADVGAGLQSDPVKALAVFGSDLYAGTYANGLWKRPLSEMIPLAAVKEVPSTHQIPAQAYPDPFLSKTMIHFTAVEPGFARVTIVNLMGKEVAQLYFGDISAGEHSFTWDAANVPAGTYFCVIQSSDGRQVVSMRRE